MFVSYDVRHAMSCVLSVQPEGEEPLVGTVENPYMPMEVLGDMSEDGLGLVQWWNAGEGAEGDSGGEEEPEEDAPMDDVDPA